MQRFLLLLLIAVTFTFVSAAQSKARSCVGCPKVDEVREILSERYIAQFTEGWMKEGDLRVQIDDIEVLPAIKRKMTSGVYDVPITVYPAVTTVRVFVRRKGGEKLEYIVGEESEKPLTARFYFFKDSNGKAWTFRTGSK